MTARVKVPGRGWAYTGAILGGLVSIAANVAHSFILPVGTVSSWTPEPGAVVGAVVWPVFLFVAVEIFARVKWPHGLAWRLVRWVGLLPVAGLAALVAYRHLSGLLAHYGEERPELVRDLRHSRPPDIPQVVQRRGIHRRSMPAPDVFGVALPLPRDRGRRGVPATVRTRRRTRDGGMAARPRYALTGRSPENSLSTFGSSLTYTADAAVTITVDRSQLHMDIAPTAGTKPYSFDLLIAAQLGRPYWECFPATGPSNGQLTLAKLMESDCCS